MFPGKSLENQSKQTQLEEEELSFFEVLTPMINSVGYLLVHFCFTHYFPYFELQWLSAGHKCMEQLSSTMKAVDEWRDLTFTKLLADALDWHDDQVCIYAVRNTFIKYFLK
jgi:hypothetical protein